MRCHTFLSSASALTLFATIFALPSPLAMPASPDSSSLMKPINVRDFEHATGMRRRRAIEDFSDLDLQTQTQLLYGRPGLKDQYVLANMTLYAPDGLQIVMMERFETWTSKVDCKGDDGEMSLTFKSKAAFEHALKTWDFINQSEEKKFLLIANHAGCGPDDERQAYIITKISEDEPNLTTFLSATPAGWDKVAGTYDLDFGQAMLAKPRKNRRGIFDDIKDLGSDVLDGIKDVGDSVGETVQDGIDTVQDGVASITDAFDKFGDFNFDKSSTFSIAVGQANQVTNILNQSFLSVDCVNCFVTGSFTLTGHLSVKGFELQDLTIDASPKGVAATLELGTSITVKDSPDSLQFTKELFSAPVPDAGISVPGIFKLGAVISYEAGITTTFAGSADFKFGLSASLPDTAKVLADISDPGQSSATGFDAANIDPIFDIEALSAKVTVAAFTQPKLFFGIELTKVGQFDINLALKLPVVSATLEAAFNDAGLCSQEPGSSKTGVQLSSEIGIELDLGIDANIGDDTKPSFSTKLAGISHPLFSHCFPLDIPGLGEVSGTTTGPAPTKTPIATSTVLPTVSSAGTIPVPLTTNPTIVPSGVYPTGTGVYAPSGTAPSYAPYPTHGNATRGSYVRRGPLRGAAVEV